MKTTAYARYRMFDIDDILFNVYHLGHDVCSPLCTLAREDALRSWQRPYGCKYHRNSTGNTTEKSVSTGDIEVQLQPNQPPAILERYRKLHEQNTDMVGWIRIITRSCIQGMIFTCPTALTRRTPKAGYPL